MNEHRKHASARAAGKVGHWSPPPAHKPRGIQDETDEEVERTEPNFHFISPGVPYLYPFLTCKVFFYNG